MGCTSQQRRKVLFSLRYMATDLLLDATPLTGRDCQQLMPAVSACCLRRRVSWALSESKQPSAAEGLVPPTKRQPPKSRRLRGLSSARAQRLISVTLTRRGRDVQSLLLRALRPLCLWRDSHPPVGSLLRSCPVGPLFERFQRSELRTSHTHPLAHSSRLQANTAQSVLMGIASLCLLDTDTCSSAL